MKKAKRRLDLQAKISLVLVAVILPTFLIITLAENEFTGPILDEEIRQLGIHAAKSLAAEIDSSRLLISASPTKAIEDAIQEVIDNQPDIVRMDVSAKEPISGLVRTIASSVEEEPNSVPQVFPLVEFVKSDYRKEADGSGSWEIYVPIEHHSRTNRQPKKLLGTVHVVVSTRMVGRLIDTLWKFKAVAAGFSVVSLILLLSYFLRKTISNDRLLKVAETHNEELSEQLHEAHRQLMLTEKLAVMGQLTANFAHELGTPLNAIGGHLQLLRGEVLPAQGGRSKLDKGVAEKVQERLEIVDGQLQKIAQIVQGFLHSTAKPKSQKQLVDLNSIVEKTLQILIPRVDSLGVEVSRKFARNLGPMRVVPLDIEQVLLNLLTNSLDSIKAKNELRQGGQSLKSGKIVLGTTVMSESGKEWVDLTVWDNGIGIAKADLDNVPKPFFTTKRVGEGTGLGLAICKQIIHKYEGTLSIDSKEGVWTKVIVRLPYHSQENAKA